MPETPSEIFPENTSSAENVMVAVTTLDHMVNTGILAFAVKMSQAPKSERIYHLTIVDGARNVAFARNKSVQYLFREKKFRRMMFIDNDTIPPENALELFDVEGDIVVGIVPVFKGQPPGKPGSMYFNIYKYLNEKDKFRPIAPYRDPRAMDVDAGGCAAMVIRREVLEDKRLWFDPNWEDIKGTMRSLTDDDAPPIFRMHYKPNGEILIGEDVDFCLRAKELGYSVKAYSGTTFGHIKQLNMFDMMVLQDAAISRGMEMARTPPKEAVGA